MKEQTVALVTDEVQITWNALCSKCLPGNRQRCVKKTPDTTMYVEIKPNKFFYEQVYNGGLEGLFFLAQTFVTVGLLCTYSVIAQ